MASFTFLSTFSKCSELILKRAREYTLLLLLVSTLILSKIYIKLRKQNAVWDKIQGIFTNKIRTLKWIAECTEVFFCKYLDAPNANASKIAIVLRLFKGIRRCFKTQKIHKSKQLSNLYKCRVIFKTREMCAVQQLY